MEEGGQKKKTRCHQMVSHTTARIPYFWQKMASSSISIPSNKSYDAVSIDPEEPRNDASSQRDDIDQLIHQGWKICRLLAGSGVAASSGERFCNLIPFFNIDFIAIQYCL